MDFQTGMLSSHLGAATVAAVMLAFAAVILWWIQRRRLIRLWLPILRIVPLQHRRLPRLQWRKPPLLPFLLFLAVAVLMALSAFEPALIIGRNDDMEQPRVHVVIDLSPSVSAVTTIAKLQQDTKQLLDKLREVAKISVGTSASLKSTEIIDAAQVDLFVNGLAFHRSGVRMGSLVRQQLKQAGTVRRLYIFSDSDSHSWGDFDWQSFSDEIEVVRIAAGNPLANQAENVFINDVRCDRRARALECTVDVQRKSLGAAPAARAVKVALQLGDSTTLATTELSFPTGTAALEWRATVAAEQLAAVQEGIPKNLQATVNSAEDVLAEDNLFIAGVLGRRQEAVMIAPISGERMIDDANLHLQRSLEVQDLFIDRFDRIDQPGPNANDYNLWFLVGGQGEGIDQFCPRSISAATMRPEQARPLRIVLLPASVQADYAELCHCLSRLLAENAGALDKVLPQCQGVNGSENYGNALKALGAQALDGTISDSKTTAVWRFTDRANTDVLALTVPLQPQVGIGFGGMPMVVKNILQVLQGSGKTKLAVPRLPDITTWLLNQNNDDANTAAMIANVPFGESLLVSRSQNDLPPKWDTDNPRLLQSQVSSIGSDRDAAIWAWLCLSLVTVIILLECLYYFRSARRLRETSSASLLLLISLGIGVAAFIGDDAFARISINMVGYEQQNYSFKQLNEEVEARTSLSLSPQLNAFGSFDLRAAEQPILWVSQAKAITGSQGRLLPNVEMWLKRGGFLIIESELSLAKLQQLVGGYAVFNAAEGSSWKVIPPDHELMRSFYLMEALPSCASQVWYGLQYDARLAVLMIPYNFLETLSDQAKTATCKILGEREQRVRAFVNLLMVTLATDYKRDQIHLPEILKRLR